MTAVQDLEFNDDVEFDENDIFTLDDEDAYDDAELYPNTEIETLDLDHPAFTNVNVNPEDWGVDELDFADDYADLGNLDEFSNDIDDSEWEE